MAHSCVVTTGMSDVARSSVAVRRHCQGKERRPCRAPTRVTLATYYITAAHEAQRAFTARRQLSLNLSAVPTADASHQAAAEMKAGKAACRRIVVVREETIDQMFHVRLRPQNLDQMRPHRLKLDLQIPSPLRIDPADHREQGVRLDVDLHVPKAERDHIGRNLAPDIDV